jgi:hypothetical protein
VLLPWVSHAERHRVVLLTNGSSYEQRLYPYTGALSRAIELMTKENMPRELCATDTGLRWRAIGVTPISNRAPSCCGSQTSLAWLANISFRGLRFADTLRTRRLALTANELRFIVTGSQTSVEGSPSVPIAVCHPYGQHTLYITRHGVWLQIMASFWNN